MRADRLIGIMILLQNKGKMTTHELAQTLEVSNRTILRDMDALSLSGIPVMAERGKTGGWKLMDHFRSAISGINLNDLKSLLILPSNKVLEELGIGTNGIDIRQKLMASMPSTDKHDARHFMEKIYVDTGTWKPTSERYPALRAVQTSLWEDKKLRITYQKSNGDCSDRLICPLGLVAKGTSWYLVALSEPGEYRSYRVSRIREVQIQPERFIRPEDFNLSEYWEQSKRTFSESLPQFEVEVLAHGPILRRMTFTDKFVQIVKVGAKGEGEMIPVLLTFNTEQDAVEYILGFGKAMRLLQPEYLVDKIVEQAKDVIGMYE